jgi:hypothetical protein
MTGTQISNTFFVKSRSKGELNMFFSVETLNYNAVHLESSPKNSWLIKLLIQNNEYWSANKHRLMHTLLFHDIKVGVWCTVSAMRITGPTLSLNNINSEDLMVKLPIQPIVQWLPY